MKTFLILLALTLICMGEEYALIQNSDKTVLGLRQTNGPMEYDAYSASAEVYWVPVIRNAQPAYDSATQRIVQTVVATTTEVTYGWQIVALTQAELDSNARQAARTTSVTEIKTLLTLMEGQTATNIDILRCIELLLKYLEFDEP